MPLTLDPAWTPPGDLLSEKTWYIGTMLVGLSYGIVLTLALLCFISLYTSITPTNRKQSTILLMYVTLTFVAATLYFAGTTWMSQLSFIDYRQYLGGPAKFEVDFFSQPIDAMANISAVVSNWLSEGLMCWRCIVIYSSSNRFIWLKRGVSIVLYVSELTLGTIWVIQISSPSSSVWATSTLGSTHINFTAPYLTLSLILNVLSSLAIAARLLYYRRKMNNALGSDAGRKYVGIVAMVIESAAAFCLLMVLVLVTYVINHPLQNTFFQMFGIAQMIPSLMIVHRVASGKAWTNEQATQVFSTMDFSSGQLTVTGERIVSISVPMRRRISTDANIDLGLDLSRVVDLTEGDISEISFGGRGSEGDEEK